jgi:hypothetical protein
MTDAPPKRRGRPPGSKGRQHIPAAPPADLPPLHQRVLGLYVWVALYKNGAESVVAGVADLGSGPQLVPLVTPSQAEALGWRELAQSAHLNSPHAAYIEEVTLRRFT